LKLGFIFLLFIQAQMAFSQISYLGDVASDHGSLKQLDEWDLDLIREYTARYRELDQRSSALNQKQRFARMADINQDRKSSKAEFMMARKADLNADWRIDDEDVLLFFHLRDALGPQIETSELAELALTHSELKPRAFYPLVAGLTGKCSSQRIDDWKAGLSKIQSPAQAQFFSKVLGLCFLKNPRDWKYLFKKLDQIGLTQMVEVYLALELARNLLFHPASFRHRSFFSRLHESWGYPRPIVQGRNPIFFFEKKYHFSDYLAAIDGLVGKTGWRAGLISQLLEHREVPLFSPFLTDKLQAIQAYVRKWKKIASTPPLVAMGVVLEYSTTLNNQVLLGFSSDAKAYQKYNKLWKGSPIFDDWYNPFQSKGDPLARNYPPFKNRRLESLKKFKQASISSDRGVSDRPVGFKRWQREQGEYYPFLSQKNIQKAFLASFDQLESDDKTRWQDIFRRTYARSLTCDQLFFDRGFAKISRYIDSRDNEFERKYLKQAWLQQVIQKITLLAKEGEIDHYLIELTSLNPGKNRLSDYQLEPQENLGPCFRAMMRSAFSYFDQLTRDDQKLRVESLVPLFYQGSLKRFGVRKLISQRVAKLDKQLSSVNELEGYRTNALVTLNLIDLYDRSEKVRAQASHRLNAFLGEQTGLSLGGPRDRFFHLLGGEDKSLVILPSKKNHPELEKWQLYYDHLQSLNQGLSPEESFLADIAQFTQEKRWELLEGKNSQFSLKRKLVNATQEFQSSFEKPEITLSLGDQILVYGKNGWPKKLEQRYWGNQQLRRDHWGELEFSVAFIESPIAKYYSSDLRNPEDALLVGRGNPKTKERETLFFYNLHFMAPVLIDYPKVFSDIAKAKGVKNWLKFHTYTDYVLSVPGSLAQLRFSRQGMENFLLKQLQRYLKMIFTPRKLRDDLLTKKSLFLRSEIFQQIPNYMAGQDLQVMVVGFLKFEGLEEGTKIKIQKLNMDNTPEKVLNLGSETYGLCPLPHGEYLVEISHSNVVLFSEQVHIRPSMQISFKWGEGGAEMGGPVSVKWEELESYQALIAKEGQTLTEKQETK
jgi:hypothetical protein